MNLLSRKNWNENDAAYVVRIDSDRRLFAWFMREHGGNWVVQVMDNETNQIGDAQYYANRGSLPAAILEVDVNYIDSMF